jgi:proteasome lid subunit RPN8/RPN11
MILILQINSSDLEPIVEHSKEDFPKEACGIMKGRMHMNDGKRVNEVAKIYRARNIHENPFIGYKMHAEDMYKAFVELDTNLELIGFYHSHPHGPNAPSKTDIDECNYHDSSFLIVSLEDFENPDVSAWILYEDRVEKEKILILN